MELTNMKYLKKINTVISSFFIMLCLGGVYAWSIFANELTADHNWSSTHTQLVFGILIAVFPTTMIFAGRIGQKVKPSVLAVISALFFSSGYIISGFSSGHFYITLFSFGVLTSIGTGFGYMAALTSPVKCFPDKKGLMTGIAAGGFGLAAVLLSLLTEKLLNTGRTIPEIFKIVGVSYGLVILVSAFFLKVPEKDNTEKQDKTAVLLRSRLKSSIFIQLFSGIFLGTFAGLLVIGNLKSMGAVYNLSNTILIAGVSAFAVFNFAGRLSWGALSDFLNGRITISAALFFQAVSIFLFGVLPHNPVTYIITASAIGFGFGANFVLFAKETSNHYGIESLGSVYPFIFLGYAIAGIFGPVTGGVIYDVFQSYFWGIITASVMSLAGAVIFLWLYLKHDLRK